MTLRHALVALLLAAPLALSTASSTGSPSVTVEMSADSYSVVGVAGGVVPLALVTVLDGEGAPVADAEVRVVFLRHVQFVGFVHNETVMARTGFDGTVLVEAPTLSSAPGSYLTAGFALGSAGSDRYTVGA